MDSDKKQNESSSSSNNKVPLESLSQEVLIKKYRALLQIAHKAKAAKDEYSEETKRLKADLQKFEEQKEADKRSIVTMTEVVDALTNSKLALTNEIQSLKKRNHELEGDIGKLDELRREVEEKSIQNESLKRQVEGLTKENEGLLLDMENMEARFKQVTEVGLDQRKHLELLEKATEKILQCEKCQKSEETIAKQAARIKRFEDRLSSVVAKLRKLKECKKILLETQHDYAESVSKWQKDIVNASNYMLRHIQKLEDINKTLVGQKENIGTSPTPVCIESQLKNWIEICDRAITEEKEQKNKLDELEKLLDSGKRLETKISTNTDKLVSLENNLSEKEALISEKEQKILDIQEKISATQSEVEQLKEVEKERDALKTELSKVKKELKKSKTNNVLHLEIAAFEKSLNETTEKLNLKTEEAAELKSLLEKSELENDTIKKEIEGLRKQVAELETESKNAKKLAKTEELFKNLQLENEKLIQQVVVLEENVHVLTEKLATSERLLEDVKVEYANYKLKAQSVLRQQPAKELSREKDLEEEISIIQSQKDAVNNRLRTSLAEIENKNGQIEELRELNDRLNNRLKELTTFLHESKEQNENLFKQNRTLNEEYQESLRTQRSQIEALNTRCKQQIEDLTTRHVQEIDDLRKSLSHTSNSAANANDLPLRIDPIGGFTSTEHISTMERENAEGSESSIPHARRKLSSRSKYDILPLGDLLSNSFDETSEVDNEHTKPTYETLAERLEIQETRVRHLTSLLAETEQDLAKATQLADLLKEEVRRHERSVGREKHMHNSEYIKNVFLKFITLNNGDERVRMIPVLNTILKLSPEETNMLQHAANGKAVSSQNKGWGSYLSPWSNGN